MTFAQDGFEVLENFIGEDLLQALAAEIAPLTTDDVKAGLRNADKKLPAVHQLAHSPLLLEKAATSDTSRIQFLSTASWFKLGVAIYFRANS